jgi:hypothetical protein
VCKRLGIASDQVKNRIKPISYDDLAIYSDDHTLSLKEPLGLTQQKQLFPE